jgi:flagellar biosynthesis/type III secretory pathway protein FliH
MTKRLRMLLITTTLIVGSAALAGAQAVYVQWGYQDRDRDWDRDRYSRNMYANARDFGYQDGFNDGRNDRLGGHSFRPTHDSNFRHADRGYYGGYGDRNYYKELYRRAYENGYERGYNSARYRGWRY